MAERYALPGQLIVGTDSHTPHSGALGCVAFGVGTHRHGQRLRHRRRALDDARSAAHRARAGGLPAGVTAKDLVLHLLALPAIRAGAGVGKVFEFGGAVVRALSIDERATLTNMTAELGGFTGIVAPDAETVRFLRERRGVDVQIEPWMKSDAGRRLRRHDRASIAARCRRWSRAPAIPATACRWPTLGERAAHRHRLWRLVHGRQARGLRPATTRCWRWAATRGLRVAARRHAVPAVRHGRRARLLHRAAATSTRSMPSVRELLQPACGACANCGPGSSTDERAGDGERDQPQFPRPLGPGPGLAGQPAHGRRQRDRRAALLVRGTACVGIATEYRRLTRPRRRAAYFLPRPICLATSV